MRFILDCNVVISAGLTKGTCRQVIRDVVKMHDLILSEGIVKEYALVSKRNKFKAHHDILKDIITHLCKVGHLVEPAEISFSLPDPANEIYLATAKAGNVSGLITGNTKHFPSKKYDKTRILTPKEFLDFTSL